MINALTAALAAEDRFEEAGVHRDRFVAFVRASARLQRLAALTRSPEMVATRRTMTAAGSVHVVRHGRLVAAGVTPVGADAHAYVDAAARQRRDRAHRLRSGAGRDRRRDGVRAALVGASGVRLVDVEGEWTCPVAGAASKT